VKELFKEKALIQDTVKDIIHYTFYNIFFANIYESFEFLMALEKKIEF
jgi:hypothetical protein